MCCNEENYSVFNPVARLLATKQQFRIYLIKFEIEESQPVYKVDLCSIQRRWKVRNEDVRTFYLKYGNLPLIRRLY